MKTEFLCLSASPIPEYMAPPKNPRHFDRVLKCLGARDRVRVGARVRSYQGSKYSVLYVKIVRNPHVYIYIYIYIYTYACVVLRDSIP